MSFIRDLFSQRDDESKRIIDGYNEFLLLYQNKVRMARDIFPRTGKVIDDKLMEELREVRKLNNRIVLNLNLLFTSTKKGALTVDVKSKNLLISDTVSKITDLQKPEQSELSVKMRQDFNQGLEYLSFIIQILQRQNERINKLEKKRDDTESSVILAQLISSEIANEAKMRILLRRFLRTLMLAVGSYDKQKLEAKLKETKFIEILAKGKELDDFFKIYVDAFPPDERDSHYVFAKALMDRFRRATMGSTFHIIVAKKGYETIGGIAFEYINTPRFSFSITWWDAIKAEYRKSCGAIGLRLGMKMAELAMRQQIIHAKPFLGIIAESNDPEKMNQHQIRSDVMDPKQRVRLWSRMGFRRIFKEYIQLTTNPEVTCEYCSLFVLPSANGQWTNGVPAVDLKDIIDAIEIIANYYTPAFLKTYEPYQRMMRIIEPEIKRGKVF